jgi:hypothetical protein
VVGSFSSQGLECGRRAPIEPSFVAVCGETQKLESLRQLETLALVCLLTGCVRREQLVGAMRKIACTSVSSVRPRHMRTNHQGGQ